MDELRFWSSEKVEKVTEIWKIESLVIGRGWVVDWNLMNHNYSH